ncbi:Bcr/CflA family efflux MFS transporter [Helicobacter sp. MIT 11-5569]|uniref:multidrug effflux MFS transporter n=1 Tax=Helicobacter sp. MIT 11-5569 TaxID=1548151 RepID=UPI00051FEFC6|nr:multidrug effflux MFS transporter [Helicobacter sp. MIT 11-5569]TLD82862.1 Bcr/CflA family efflux MFS transporter [Helicobacter sp. MIT 11-5569]
MQKQKISSYQGFAKTRLIFVLAFMSSLAPLSTDMYLPALGAVQISFATTPFYTQLSLAVFFVAFAFGQLLYGPLSDIYGRKKPLYFGIALFIVASIMCVSFDSVHSFIFWRFLQALGGCAGVVIARAIINDNFELKEAASAFALMMVVSSLAPMLAPVFGSFLLDFFSWKSIFATLFSLGILLLIFITFGIQDQKPKTTTQSNFQTILHNYFHILKDRRFRVYVLSASFVMATIFAYITGSSFLFREYFGLSEKAYGILFGINALSFMIFANINARIVRKISPYAILPYAFVVMFGIGIAMIIVGWLDLGFLPFEILLFLMLGMNGFIVPNTTTLAMARFKQASGSASAILGMAQFAVAGAISFVVGAVEANTPFPLALIIACCLLIACGIYFNLNAREVRRYKRKFFGL